MLRFTTLTQLSTPRNTLIVSSYTIICLQLLRFKPLAARNVRLNATLTRRHTTVARLSGGNGSGSDRGGAVLDRPGFLTGDRFNTLETESGRGSKQGDGGRGMGGGSHRVLLLDSPNHTEKAVVDAI